MTSYPGSLLESDVARILRAIGQPPEQQQIDRARAFATPMLIVTIGLPGSGKSTFARRLAAEVDAVCLESDALRRLLFVEPEYSRRESRRLFAALHRATGILLHAGRHLIIDATNLTEPDRRPLYALADGCGARLLLLSFEAPVDVIEKRLALRSEQRNTDDNSSAGLRVYRMMAGRAEAPSRDYLSIDTSDATATRAAFSRVVEACGRFELAR